VGRLSDTGTFHIVGDWGVVRLGLISDPHANLPALAAVLRALDGEGVDRIVCAGDLVGYNPWPNEVLALLQDRGVVAIRGNHDRAALAGKAMGFNAVATTALAWTVAHLTPEATAFLRNLEDRTRFAAGSKTVAVYHGSSRYDDEYVYPGNATEDLVRAARAQIVVLGHTHLPMFFAYPSGIVVNPGGVGQPRDRDSRAPYAILDTDTEEWRVERVAYDIPKVQGEILRVGLPPVLAERLAAGR